MVAVAKIGSFCKRGFEPIYKNTQFSGKIELRYFKRIYSCGGITKHSCIANAVIHNCTIGDNIAIENIQNYIANIILEIIAL